MASSSSWRRFLRVSLPRLIVLVVAIGLWLGWLARCARIQREAVATIGRTNCLILYDWQWKNGSYVPGGKPWAPRWLSDLIGVHFLGSVVVVSFRPGSTTSDKVLENVGRFTRLVGLNLNGTSVSDASLAHLTELKDLYNLDLDETQVADAGLVHLEGLTELTYLNLRKTRITDAGLVHLKGLSKLSWLVLNGTQVTDSGVQELRRALPNLKIYR